jgi:hypothetical protein
LRASRRQQPLRTCKLIADFKAPVDCANLALLGLVEFASPNGLPIRLKTYVDGS